MSGGCESGESTVARLKKLLELTQADRPFPNFEQSPSHIPDHMMEEAIAFNRKQQAATPLPQFTSENSPDGAVGRRACFCEACKIMLTDKLACCILHFFKINSVRKMEELPRQVRRHNGSNEDLIPVHLGKGASPGVKFRRHPACRKNPNIPGKHAVEGPDELPGRNA